MSGREKSDERLSEQKDHYEGYISTLHDIIEEKSTKIKALECQINQLQTRKSIHHEVTKIEMLKLMLEKQTRLNVVLQQRLIQSNSVTVGTQTDQDMFLSARHQIKRMNEIIYQVSESVVSMLENASLLEFLKESGIDSNENRLELIFSGLNLLKTQIKVLQTQYLYLKSNAIKFHCRQRETYAVAEKQRIDYFPR
jgi:hypothetical protein